MENPWADKSNYSSQWVLKCDQEAVEKFQAKQGLKPKYQLRTDVAPEPWCGPIKTAKVLLLASNPHWDERDDKMPQRAHDLMWENLSGEFPLYCLHEDMKDLSGGIWYRNRALKNLLQIIPESRVAADVCLVDLVAYRSHEWHSALRVPSSDYMASQVNAAIDRESVIVVLRSRDEWLSKIPRLEKYPFVFMNKSWQQPRISERNTCLNLDREEISGSFQAIVRKLVEADY